MRDRKGAAFSRAMLALCGAAAPGAPWPGEALAACGEWERLTEEAARHGLAGLLAPPEGDPAAALLPPEVRAAWERARLIRAARSACALRQWEELARALARRDIPVLPLKGAAALLWLYEARETGDLDLLVPEERHGEAVQVLERLGYEWSHYFTSPEAARAQLRRGSGWVFERAGAFRVDLHAHLLKRPGLQHATPAAIWNESVLEEHNGATWRRLAWPHFLMHASIHYMRHLRLEFAALKGLADITVVVTRHGASIDWPAFWRTAGEWEIRRDVATVMATAVHHFGVSVPGLPAAARPLPAAWLLAGRSPRPLFDSSPVGLACRRVSRSLAALRADLRELADPGERARCFQGWLRNSRRRVLEIAAGRPRAAG